MNAQEGSKVVEQEPKIEREGNANPLNRKHHSFDLKGVCRNCGAGFVDAHLDCRRRPVAPQPDEEAERVMGNSEAQEAIHAPDAATPVQVQRQAVRRSPLWALVVSKKDVPGYDELHNKRLKSLRKIRLKQRLRAARRVVNVLTLKLKLEIANERP